VTRYEVIPGVNPAMPSHSQALLVPFTHNKPTGGPWWANLITSTLGTVGVGSPRPGIVPTSMDRRTAGSYNSPDFFFPQISYASPAHCHGPVNRVSSNMMPVPAAAYDNLPGIAQRRPRIGGQNQVSQPAATQSWPDLYARNNGSSNGNAGWKD
jgi:hypothetical protein